MNPLGEYEQSVYYEARLHSKRTPLNTYPM